MSGLQGSITTQVAKEYLDVNTGECFCTQNYQFVCYIDV